MNMTSRNIVLFLSILLLLVVTGAGVVLLYDSSNETPDTQSEEPETTATTTKKNGGIFDFFRNYTPEIPRFQSSRNNDGDASDDDPNKPPTLTSDDIEDELQTIERKVEEIAKEIETLKQQELLSIYNEKITIYRVRRSSNDQKPANEYITLKVSKSAGIKISIAGWKLRSAKTGRSVSLGKGVYLFYDGQTNTPQDITLESGDEVFVSTGSSPMGFSFEVNKCSGYFEQFHNFIPALSKKCPLVSDEDLPTAPNTLSDRCLNYLEQFPRCSIRTEPLPDNIEPECRSFLDRKANYNSCVDLHKNDTDFYSKEWRIFLNRGETLWKAQNENIELVDTPGKIGDVFMY